MVEAMGAASRSARIYRFGAFAVDVRTGELTNAGRRTPLREQPFQLLLALLEQPGEPITREELRVGFGQPAPSWIPITA
jgi:DNA-binding winged helix-turn-helix (wHTH) protein